MNVVTQARCHHHSFTGYGAFVLKSKGKAVFLMLNCPHVGLVSIGDGLLIKPEAVVDHRLACERINETPTTHLTKLLKPMLFLGIRNVGGPPERAQ